MKNGSSVQVCDATGAEKNSIVDNTKKTKNYESDEIWWYFSRQTRTYA